MRHTLLSFLSLFMCLPLISCGELISQEGEGCSLGTDCVWPSVCCTAPRIPSFGSPIPQCAGYDTCDAFLPFLVEGNPCNRTPGFEGMPTAYETCSEGLVCCPKTLTCLDQVGCDETPEPPPASTSPSGKSCTADPDCPEGELCMGIYMLNRQGMCAPFGSAPVPDRAM